MEQKIFASSNSKTLKLIGAMKSAAEARNVLCWWNQHWTQSHLWVVPTLSLYNVYPPLHQSDSTMHNKPHSTQCDTNLSITEVRLKVVGSAREHNVMYYKWLSSGFSMKTIKKSVKPDPDYAGLYIALLNKKPPLLDLVISRTGQSEPCCQLDYYGLTLNCTLTAAALSLGGGEGVASRLAHLQKTSD